MGLIADIHIRNMLLAYYHKNERLFDSRPASTKYHHSWDGGLGDHIAQVMELGMGIFNVVKEQAVDMSCTLDDVLIIGFIHDLDKLDKYTNDFPGAPWKYKEGRLNFDEIVRTVHICTTDIGLVLTENQLEALSHHHGMWSNDRSSVFAYRPNDMTTLSAITHTADLISTVTFGSKKP